MEQLAARLLDLFMQRVTLKMRIVFLFFDPPLLLLFVPGRHIARGRFTFCAGFGAFECDVFAWHVGDC